MLLFLVLFALWLLLNGRVTLELILIGAAVSGAVWLFCYRTLGYRPQRERVLLRRLPHYAHYAAALTAEIFKANLTVMRAILSGRPCRPAIRRVHLPLREASSRMLLANSITLTPGTVTVAVEDEDFLVLCLDAESADALPDWKLTTMLTKMEEETCS